MRLSIDHRTVYRFSEPQARLVQLLRLTPSDTDDQTIAAWHIDVDCDARMRDGRDGFGNRTTMLYADGPIDRIEIAVSGEVLTSAANGIVRGEAEALPPPLYLRATPATTSDDAIAGFRADAVAGASDLLDAMHRLNTALHARFAIDRVRPEPGLTAAAAFARDTVTPRDLTHILLAAARSHGVPARYVSGYRLNEAASPRATPHGWAEAHIERIGWVGFDPCLGLSPEDRHVRVAIALDAAGAAPVAGSRLGEGHERLEVDVDVRVAGPD